MFTSVHIPGGIALYYRDESHPDLGFIAIERVIIMESMMGGGLAWISWGLSLDADLLIDTKDVCFATHQFDGELSTFRLSH